MHMDYCMEHPEELTKVAAVQKKVCHLPVWFCCRPVVYGLIHHILLYIFGIA